LPLPSKKKIIFSQLSRKGTPKKGSKKITAWKK